MEPKTITLRIISYKSNPMYRNPRLSEMIIGSMLVFSTEIGTIEAKLETLLELGMDKPFPYRLKGKVFRSGRPTARYEAEYNPTTGLGKMVIQSF